MIIPEEFSQTATSITMVWEAQTGLTGYIVEYMKIFPEMQWFTWPDVLDPTATSVTVTGLDPDTDYIVQVTAVNSLGTATTGAVWKTDSVVPAVPTGLEVTDVTFNSATLAWQQADYATGYIIQYRSPHDIRWSTKIVGGGSTTSYTVPGLSPNTAYTFQICATNSTGDSDWSDPAEATTAIAPPTTPINFHSNTQTTSSVSLVWGAQENVTGFVLEYKQSADSQWLPWPASLGATATSATVTGLDIGTAYDFRLTAVNSVGSASATTTMSTRFAAPTAPANFQGTSPAYNSVALSWDTQANLSSYKLEFKRSIDSTWSTWTPAPGKASTAATITGLTANTAYDFRLTATNGSGSATSTATVTTKIAPPTSPGNFRPTAQTSDSVTLQWVAQANLAGYTLEYKKASESGWTPWEPAPDTSAATATLTGLDSNTDYEFRLTATNISGSNASTTTATTKVAAPTAPANFRSTDQTNTSVTLAWDTQASLTSYTLEYKKPGELNWSMWTPAPGTSSTSATITGLTANAAYEFRLTATNVSGSAVATASATTKVAPPTAPGNFRSTAQTSNSVTLMWIAQSNLTGYTLEYKKSADSSWTPWTPAPAATAAFATITGLDADTAYDFRLAATNASGSVSSTTAATTKIAPPAAPANFRSTAQTSDSVTLAWDAQANLTGYALEYKKVADPAWTMWSPALSASATSATILELAGNTAYEFRLTAANVSGSTAATTTATTPIASPAAPANFHVTNQTNHEVILEWEAQADVAGYTLHYKKSVDSEWLTWSPAPDASATSATIIGLAANTAYDFRLTASNASGLATSTTGATTNVDPPRGAYNFRSTAQTSDSITLAWQGQENLTGYTLEYGKVTDDFLTTWIPAPDATATSVTITGLDADTAYYFLLFATNVSGWSATPTTATTKVAPPVAPVNFISTAQTHASVTLTWEPQANVTAYRVSASTK